MPSMTTDSNDEPITAMDIYNYFPESNRDGMKIRFFHAANSKEDLALALEGKKLFCSIYVTYSFYWYAFIIVIIRVIFRVTPESNASIV